MCVSCARERASERTSQRALSLMFANSIASCVFVRANASATIFVARWSLLCLAFGVYEKRAHIKSWPLSHLARYFRLRSKQIAIIIRRIALSKSQQLLCLVNVETPGKEAKSELEKQAENNFFLSVFLKLILLKSRGEKIARRPKSIKSLQLYQKIITFSTSPKSVYYYHFSRISKVSTDIVEFSSINCNIFEIRSQDEEIGIQTLGYVLIQLSSRICLLSHETSS